MKFSLILVFLLISLSSFASATDSTDDTEGFEPDSVDNDPFYNPPEGSEETISDEVEVEEDAPTSGDQLGRQRGRDYGQKTGVSFMKLSHCILY